MTALLREIPPPSPPAIGLDALLARIPVLDERTRRIEQKVDQLLAALASARGRWVTIRQYAEAKSISRDTVERLIDAGELRVDRVRPDVISEKTGRRRRTLRVWLEPPIDEGEVREIAAEMTRGR